MEPHILLEKIRAYCAEAGMQPSTFGKHAVNDGKLVSRLEANKQVLLKTATAIADFIEKNPPSTHRGDAA